VRGYEVVTSDDRRVGTVSDVRDGCLVVETGRLRRRRRPVPREFAHTVDEAGKVFVTVPRAALRDAPRVRRSGDFDVQEVARHYGLVAAYEGTGGRGPAEHRRAELRRQMRPGSPERHGPPFPSLPGEHRLEESRIRE
jgi:hypothetical protein